MPILTAAIRSEPAAVGRQAVQVAAAGLLAAGLLSGCAGGRVTRQAAGAAGKVITVSAQACGTGWQHPAAGVQTFQIRNTANAPQDVALIDADTGAVFARLEAIGPGTTRPMQVDVGSGAYAFECSSQNFGDRIGPAIRVGGHARGGVSVTPVVVTDMLTAISQSRAYVASGLTTLAGQTGVLAAKIKAGELAGACAAWLSAHLTYERLGSAYGMFGDYDEEIDGVPYGLPEGVYDPGFTGFYRLEYGLWHGQSAAELTGPADRLDNDVRALRTAFPDMTLLPAFGLGDLALRTHEILEHALRFQISGQDEFGSGTTLASTAANIDGTRELLTIMHPLLVTRYQSLPAVYTWLDRLQRLVDASTATTTTAGSCWPDWPD